MGCLSAHALRPVPGRERAQRRADDAYRLSGFRFRLYSADWDELGEFETTEHRGNTSAGTRVLARLLLFG